jgi:predicted CXXCH cytochrome family protein
MGCIDCHEPHGRDPGDPDYRYRNLQWPSDPGREPIIKAFVKPGVTGLEAYEQSNIGYAAPNTKISDWREVSSICFDCHDIFKSAGYTKNADGIYIRHPSTDSERGIRAAINQDSSSTDPEHWRNGNSIGFEIGRLPFIVSGATNYMEATNVATKADKITNEVFCLTCHKAHGSRYKNSLRWSEDSNLGCQQCHNKG